MQTLRHASILGAAALFTAATAFGQTNVGDASRGGLGDLRDYVDVETATGTNLCLGVAFLNGNTYVSAGDGAGPGGEHTVYCIDGAGAVTSFLQLETTATSGFGYRDGATDGISLMFGSENGLFVVDPVTGALATDISIGGVLTPLAANPITGPGLTAIGNYRGVAYDEATGRLWSASFGGDLIEYDITGTVINTYANDPGNQWSIYGLAYDSCTDSLWCNSAPNAGRIAQIDLTTGALTGEGFNRGQGGSAQGGLSVGPTLPFGGTTLVGLDQGTPDAVGTYRVHLYKTPYVDGTGEARLITAIDGGSETDDRGPTSFTDGSMITYGITEPRGGNIFTPVMIAFNIFGDALVDGTTSLAPGSTLAEFNALSEFSTPQGLALWGQTYAGARPVVTVPAGLFADGDIVRAQGIYPKIPENGGPGFFFATNELLYQFEGPKLSVSAEGANNFSADRYWTINNTLGCQIDSITLDWAASSNLGQATMVWDVDQGLLGALGGSLNGGENNFAGCENSYRDGTEVATGLDFAGTAASTCDPAAGNLGYTPDVASPASAKTLTFNFSSFNSGAFVFDCDTDGGLGVSGAAMEGLVVTIVTPNGNLTGELAVDPNNALRSFIEWTVCP